MHKKPTMIPKPTTEKIEKMILELIAEIDYDIYKGYIPDTSEEPDEIPQRMASLVAIVEKHMTNKVKSSEIKNSDMIICPFCVSPSNDICYVCNDRGFAKREDIEKERKRMAD